MIVGQAVVIRPDLKLGAYGTNTVVRDMIQYRGKLAVIAEERFISRGDGGKEFSLKIGSQRIPWNWTPEMLIPADNEMIEVFYYGI